MIRARISLNQGVARVRSMDLVHDMIVSQMIAGGAEGKDVIGEKSLPWNFAFICHPEKQRNGDFAWRGREIVVSTPSEKLADIWRGGDLSKMKAAKAVSGEMVDFREASMQEIACPIGDDDSCVGILMLSPMALRAPKESGKRWVDEPSEFEKGISAAPRIGQIAGKDSKMEIQLDSFAVMRGSRDGSMFGKRTLKIRDGKPIWALGFMCPAVLSGAPSDLKLAWHSGLGSLTRMGFGMFDKIGGLGAERTPITPGEKK